MRLHVIGRSSPFAGPGETTPGYVLEGKQGNVLLDCGTGVSAAYLARYDLSSLQAVVISHLHPDHCADLFPLGFAVLQARRKGQRRDKVPLYLPPEGKAIFATLLQVLGDLGKHFDEVYEYREYAREEEYRIGEWQVVFHPTCHGMNCHGMVFTSARGSKFGYTGDTQVCPGLSAFFQGTDLLLCEAGGDSAEQARTAKHLMPEEAGELAGACGVGTLLLTHFLPGTKAEEKVAAAATTFGGRVEAAEPGKTYVIEN